MNYIIKNAYAQDSIITAINQTKPPIIVTTISPINIPFIQVSPPFYNPAKTKKTLLLQDKII